MSSLSALHFLVVSCSFLFYDPSPTVIYTLSLHDALPISLVYLGFGGLLLLALFGRDGRLQTERPAGLVERDRKSTRLNSSHGSISYAVFCLKKKNRE